MDLSYSHRPLFTKLDEMTDSDSRMNPLHSEINTDDARIRINPEILDFNPGSLLVEAPKIQEVRCTWRWQRYALLLVFEAFLVIQLLLWLVHGLSTLAFGKLTIQ